MARFRITQEDINRTKLVDPGIWYPCKVTGVSEKLSNKGDSMNTNVDLVITSGPFAGVVIYRTFNEKAPGAVIPYLKAFGVEVVADEEYDLAATVDRYVMVCVNHREYNGKLYNDAVDFKPMD